MYNRYNLKGDSCITMEDNDQAVKQSDSLVTNTSQNRLSSYNFLLRMSKRMGVVATRSFVEMRQFLNQDITVSQSERFLAGMPRLHLQKKQQSSVSSSSDNGEEKTGGQSTGGATNSQSTPEENDAAKNGMQEAEEEKAKAVKEGENEIDVTNDDLEKIISQSHEVLIEASTVFPVTLFPDTVIVDRTKVTIVKRDFFWSSDTMTFRIEDVLNAEVTVGPLFGSLTIASRVMSTTDHFRIDHFWRKDAMNLKRIIQGYIIAQHNKIDVAHLSRDELVKTLSELGYHREN